MEASEPTEDVCFESSEKVAASQGSVAAGRMQSLVTWCSNLQL